MTKTEARAAARAIWRAQSPAALREMGARLCANLFARPEWRAASTLLCFVPLPSEPDISPALDRALAEGKTLAVPRVLGEGRMEWVRLDSLDALRPAAFGIREPVRGTVLDPAGFAPDTLILVPCLAADRQGVRLGRGGGYYDRFLAQYNGRRLLVCPEVLLAESLPRDAWDICFAPGELLTDLYPKTKGQNT